MANKGLSERVLIECGRGSGRDFYVHRYAEEWDGAFIPNRVAKWHHNEGGRPKDNLGPLQRWLRSHVGQNWNKVYSKFCKQVKTKTASGLHVQAHMRQYVHTNVVYVDGEPCYWYWGELRVIPFGDFYVDQDGILQASPKKNNKFSDPPVRVFSVVDRGVDYFHFPDERGGYTATGKWVDNPSRREGWYIRFNRTSVIKRSKLMVDDQGRPVFYTKNDFVHPNYGVPGRPKLTTEEVKTSTVFWTSADRVTQRRLNKTYWRELQSIASSSGLSN